jgi:hypothetical protein
MIRQHPTETPNEGTLSSADLDKAREEVQDKENEQ